MTYSQTIDYLYNRLPMFSRIGAAAYKKDLDNTIHLCKALHDPQHQFKSIHIAGTNGKGSTSHMLAAVFQAAGYKTGLYTSPHLKDFRERIKINGKEIGEQFVIDFVEKMKPISDAIEPSFFEITVAMAFDYFAQQQVDIAIIETGLGGRLDSTNIITPELAVVTNIGMDHMNMLGNSLHEIASEKAGIIKPGIPVVIGETIPATKEVFIKRSTEVKAPIHFASENFWISDWHFDKNGLVATVAHHQLDQERQTYHLDLPGIYQLNNLCTVIESLHRLRLQGWHIEEEKVKKGLSQVKKLTGLHGRWEVIHLHPTVVLDVAHNQDGIAQLVQQLEHVTYQNLHIILGTVKDKDTSNILSLLPVNARYYFTKAQIARALPEDELIAMAEKYDLKGNAYPEVNQALSEAKAKATPDDLILVCGSVFIVGEVNK